MTYTSDALKKEYRRETDKQRVKNLNKIREDIARLSLSDFAKETGITKNDLSLLENGDKTLSLFHIQTYKKFFLENHGINLSVDFLMGYTDIMENSNLNYQNEIGLSSDAINHLIKIKQTNIDSLNVLNDILADTMLPQLLISIEQLSNAIKEEIAYENLLKESGKRTDKLFLQEEQNDFCLLHELEKLYPNLKNRIFVSSGQGSINRRIDDILDIFNIIVNDITGYNEMIKL